MKCVHNILSLGAGIQSSTILLMALEGELSYQLDAVIYADPGWEPRASYEYVDFLEELCVRKKIPFYRVSKGNIREDALSASKLFASMPLFVLNSEGKMAMIRRQCTNEYKIQTVRSCIYNRIIHRDFRKNKVNLIMGISADEANRQRFSQVNYIQHQYPLCDQWITRFHCIKWLTDHGYPIPPKSACIGCPFHDDEYWEDMKVNRPDEFADAVEFDYAIRNRMIRFKLKSPAYLHPSCKPLDQVDFNPKRNQLRLFSLAECTGYCGN